jgi:uncharacterized protein (DUF1697 family)
MPRFVTLLRGVNVGGSKKLKMSELSELYSSLGLEDVRTYIQSGNVVFSTSQRNTSGLVKRIQNELKDHLGSEVTVFIRTPDELGKIVAENPFLEKDRTRLHVTFLYGTPEEAPMAKLNTARSNGEEFSILGREVFLFLPNGMGRTKLSNSFFEKVLRVPATTRNWNTVISLLEMAKRSSQVGLHRTTKTKV